MKNNKQEVKKLANGDVEVTISFDITKHGHKLGLPRNYNVSKVQKLIRSKEVQSHIESGYALGLYGHGNRDTKNPLVAKEKNPMGEDIEPICKTTQLSIRGNIITHTQRIVANEWGKKVMKLLDSGFGGFSFVWDIKNEKFGGADYVLSPNFNGNRVLVESICADGTCKLDSVMDSIVTEALDGAKVDETIFDDVKDLLLHNHSIQEILLLKKKFGSMRDEYEKSIEELTEKVTITNKKQKTLEKELEKEKRNNLEATSQIAKLNLHEEGLEDNLEKLELEVNRLKNIIEDDKVSFDLSNINDSIESKYNILVKQIEDNGLSVTSDGIEFNTDALGGIMFNQYPKEISKVDMDAVVSPQKAESSATIDFSQFAMVKR
jgi:septum formation inhibitor MinC